MNELTVETRQLDEITLLYPRGFINAHTVVQFEGALRDVMQQERFKIVLNCQGLAYIASAGLGAIMGAIEEIRASGGDLRLADMSDSVGNIFEILGFHRVYRIFPSEADAINSFRQGRDA